MAIISDDASISGAPDDDLLDFHELLENDGWFTRLSAMVHG